MLPGTPNQTIFRKVCAYGMDIYGVTGPVASEVYLIDSEPPHGGFLINS